MDNQIFEHDNVILFKLEAVDRIEQSHGDFTEERMLIGFFDSAAECDKIESDYRLLPGFSLSGCSFVRTPYEFSSAESTDVDRVFYVQSCIAGSVTDEETVLEIGLFLTEDEAESAKRRFLSKRESGSQPEADIAAATVYIDEYGINQRQWQDGFNRYTYY